MFRFEGKSVIVTGSSGGIGRATAIAFAEEGARVALADVKEAENAETLEMITSMGGTAIALNVDVSDEAQVRQMVATTVEQFGGLDIAVNNAGIFQPAKPLHEQDNATFEKVIGVNLQGVWLCMKYQIAAMLSRGKGAIVNTTSFASVGATPMAAFYGASKHGVLGLTKAAAVEYASQGIRINAVGPGATMTPMLMAQAQQNPHFAEEQVEGQEQMLPIGRVASAEELARPILFLASDDASYMVGHNMMVDGGMSID